VKLKKGLKTAMSISSEGNCYLQFRKLYKEDPASCAIVMRTSVGLVYLLASLLEPFMPSISIEILPDGHKIGVPEHLFEELTDKEVQSYREKFAGSQAERKVKADEADAKEMAKQLKKAKFSVEFMAEAARYPPGLDNPSQATCKNKEFKECYNLPHVCPKFCGESGCHVNCVSCKPVCGPDDGSSSSPPEGGSPPVYPSPPNEPTPSPPVYPSPPTEPTPSPPVYPSPPTEPTPSPPSPTPTPVTPSTPPSSEVSAKRRSRCRNPKYGKCYNVEHVCPAACPTECVVDCVTCKPMC
ncbi:hypothetical protein MKW94_002034, partial [Papaver nudicaule]|nr:hypothetical protein [Papaver nudicaule]